MSYVSRWQQLKKDFETDTAEDRPKLVKDTIFGTIQKASGITPALKEIDDAIAKKQRKPLAQAINKYMVTRGPFSQMLATEASHASKNKDNILEVAYLTMASGLNTFAREAAEDLKNLQEAKEPGKVAVAFLEIEGDVKATIAKAKTELAAFAALEKKHKVLATADAALKETEKYTKAAARMEYKTAVDALTKFKAAAKKCGEDLAKVLPVEKTNVKFTAAVQHFHDAMHAFSTVTRVDEQIKKLKQADADSAG